MTEAKHTPGPWIAAEKCMHQQFVEIVHSDARAGAASLVLARVACRQSWMKEQLANARLIAAAPELLKALQEILDAADGSGWKQLDATLVNARAAIAKATGK